MITTLYDDLQNLRSSTEILEALDWDDAKFSSFMNELELMLISAPPNVEKALFWMKNTPWETFDREHIPPNVYVLLEKNIRMWELKMKGRISMAKKINRPASKLGSKPRWGQDYDEWN